MVDDMRCAYCGTDVYSEEIESYSLTRWVPGTKSNVLLAVYCSTNCVQASALAAVLGKANKALLDSDEFRESLDQMRRGEGRVVRPRPEEPESGGAERLKPDGADISTME